MLILDIYLIGAILIGGGGILGCYKMNRKFYKNDISLSLFSGLLWPVLLPIVTIELIMEYSEDRT